VGSVKKLLLDSRIAQLLITPPDMTNESSGDTDQTIRSPEDGTTEGSLGLDTQPSEIVVEDNGDDDANYDASLFTPSAWIGTPRDRPRFNFNFEAPGQSL
jgi:hypothetical protein